MASETVVMETCKDSSHGSSMLSQMYDYWNDGKYTDVTLLIDGHKIKSHKIVLASLSRYFHRVFDDENSERISTGNPDDGEVYPLNSVDYDSFSLLLKFAYTGTVTVTAENAQELLICADFLCIDVVKQACEEFISKNTDSNNCIDLFHFAHTYVLPKLEQHTLNCIGECFENVMMTDGFLSLPVWALMKLCQGEDLVMMRRRVPLPASIQELCLLKGILRYAENRPETDREGILTGFLKVVRLPLIDYAELMSELDNWRHLTSLTGVNRLVQLAQQLCLLKDSLKHALLSPEAEREPYLLEKLQVDHFPLIDLATLMNEIDNWDDLKSLSSVQALVGSVTQRKSSAAMASDIPVFWGYNRKPSRLELYKCNRRFANGNQVGRPSRIIDNTEYIEYDDHIQQIKIWTRKWDGRPVLSGIQVQYNSGKILTYGKKVSNPEIYVAEYIAEFDEDEVITRVEGACGYLIDRLEFHTNRGQILGPFGGHGGCTFVESADRMKKTKRPPEAIPSDTEDDSSGESDASDDDFQPYFKSRKPMDSLNNRKRNDHVFDGYLHAIVAGEVVTQGDLAISHLGFVWMRFENLSALKSVEFKADGFKSIGKKNKSKDTENDGDET